MKVISFFIFEKAYIKKFFSVCGQGFDEIFPFGKGNGLLFLCLLTGLFQKDLLKKGNGLTFLYLKEKLQKKQTSPSLDPLVGMETAYRKASSSLRERLR